MMFTDVSDKPNHVAEEFEIEATHSWVDGTYKRIADEKFHWGEDYEYIFVTCPDCGEQVYCDSAKAFSFESDNIVEGTCEEPSCGNIVRVNCYYTFQVMEAVVLRPKEVDDAKPLDG